MDDVNEVNLRNISLPTDCCDNQTFLELCCGNITFETDVEEITNRTTCCLFNVLYASIGFVAILANVVAFISLMSLKNKAEVMIMFYISLAIADIVNPVVQVAWSAKDPECNTDNDPYTEWTIVLSCFQIVSFYAVVFTTFGLSCDRLTAILKPLEHPQLVTHFRVRFFLCTSWTISLAGGFIPTLPFLQHIMNSTKADVDILTDEQTLHDYDTYTVYALTALFSIATASFVFLIFVYSIIFYEIYQRYNKKSIIVNHQMAPNLLKSAITSMIIVCTFAATWLPWGLNIMITVYADIQETSQQQDNRHGTLFALVFLNSICDPIIYISGNRKVRKSFYRILWSIFKCHKFRPERQPTISSSPGTSRTSIGLKHTSQNGSTYRLLPQITKKSLPQETSQ